MNSSYADLEKDEAIVARLLIHYHKIWQSQFPNLVKRAHWHAIFSTRRSGEQGVSCRTLHRALYGAYGTDIRTCIERVRDCEKDGFIRSVDASQTPCPAAATSFIVATDKLRSHFDRHCSETITEVAAVFGASPASAALECGETSAAAIYEFFGAYDRHWREAGETVVRNKGLTVAYAEDAMNHLVTYQYWAIVMLLWCAGPSAADSGSTAMIVDEINSRMWDVLHLGHLAIKERVDNLIRWGFFTEQTIRKHKAVSLSPVAGQAVGKSLLQTMPLLRELQVKLTPAAPVDLRIVRTAAAV